MWLMPDHPLPEILYKPQANPSHCLPKYTPRGRLSHIVFSPRRKEFSSLIGLPPPPPLVPAMTLSPMLSTGSFYGEIAWNCF
jgi:hypothetical protein